MSNSKVTPRGLQFDRQWLVVDPEGQFLTQRTFPFMSQITPQINEIKTSNGHAQSDSSSTSAIDLHLTAPGMPPLVVQSTGSGSKKQVQVWSSTCLATDEGDEVAAWLSTFLETTCRLVRFEESFVRAVDDRYAKSNSDQVGFADGFPFLLISQASLDDLNGRLAAPLPMNRFRPNIVVDGCTAFAEDDWKEFHAGGLRFYIVKPCDRCVITCTDQENSKVSTEPLRTLAKYRLKENKVLFGQNLVHSGRGALSVGDEVTLSVE